MLDPETVDAMHYNRRSNGSSNKEYITKRGTSKLEGYHSHLHDVLSGNNYSGELANVLILFFNFRWNVRRGIDNLDYEDYCTPDLWRLEKVNQCAEQLGLSPPHPGMSRLHILPKTEETFGTNYAPPWADLRSAKADVDAAAREEEPQLATGDCSTGDNLGVLLISLQLWRLPTCVVGVSLT